MLGEICDDFIGVIINLLWFVVTITDAKENINPRNIQPIGYYWLVHLRVILPVYFSQSANYFLQTGKFLLMRPIMFFGIGITNSYALDGSLVSGAKFNTVLTGKGILLALTIDIGHQNCR